MADRTKTGPRDQSTRVAPEISIVLPAHNEATNVAVVLAAVSDALAGEEIELVFVDDGSTDGTAETVAELKRQDPRVRLIRLSRNFGHQAALMAGLSMARGDAIITMDCDMQHPPKHLPDMVLAWREGHKIVQMVRKDTVQIDFIKKFFSAAFYRALNLISDFPIVAGAADFQLLDRQVVQHLNNMKGRSQFIRGIVNWLGFNPARIEYTASERHSGVASYSFWKSLSLAKAAVLSTSRAPLRLGIYFGLAVALLCFVYIVYSIALWTSGTTIPGWTSLMVMMLFVGSVQIIILGIIGEYIGQIYDLQRNLPPFVFYSEDDAP